MYWYELAEESRCSGVLELEKYRGFEHTFLPFRSTAEFNLSLDFDTVSMQQGPTESVPYRMSQQHGH